MAAPPATAAKKYRASPAKVAPDPTPLPPLKLPANVLAGIPALLPDDGGLEWLQEHEGLFMRQHMGLAELAGCEASNRFMIAPFASGVEIPDEPTNNWAYPIREEMESVPALHAREVGDCLDRVCCPLTRGYRLDFADAVHVPYFTVVRKSACEPCGCWPMLYSRAQQLSVLDRRGELVSRAIEPVAVCRACWTRSYVAVDADGEPLYTLRASDCGSQNGCNFCAPSCANESYDVDVFAPDGAYLTSATWVWPGCACNPGILTDRSNIVIRFPAGATATQRAALVGGVLLIEYTSMELKRLQEGQGGTQGGAMPGKAGPGGAPTSQEMAR